MDPLYTSPVLAARREVSSLALCSEDGDVASVCAKGRRVELQARLFHGGVSRQWRVCILGARPRPLDPQRLLHLIQDGGCLPWLFSKPASDGALVDLWLAAFGFWRWTTAMESGGFGLQGFQGLACNFFVF